MDPWLNKVKVSCSAETRKRHFCYCLFIQGGTCSNMLKTRSPSVLSPQLTASRLARTVAPAAGRIPVCVAQASRGPAVRRWPQSRCTYVNEAPWGASSLEATFSRETNRRGSPQRERAPTPPRSRPRDLRPPNSRPTLRKWFPVFIMASTILAGMPNKDGTLCSILKVKPPMSPKPMPTRMCTSIHYALFSSKCSQCGLQFKFACQTVFFFFLLTRQTNSQNVSIPLWWTVFSVFFTVWLLKHLSSHFVLNQTFGFRACNVFLQFVECANIQYFVVFRRYIFVLAAAGRP